MTDLSRTELLLGSDGLERMKRSRVIVFGAGGVGGYVIEGLVRSGLGAVDIVDNDVISPSNINRQIIALHSSMGLPKTEAFARRIADISPDCAVTLHDTFFLPENSADIDFSLYDFAVDAIDTVTGKLEVIRRAKEAGVPVISSMGTGNKLYPERLRITDISKTSVCPLAKVMRYELKKRGIKGVPCLWSDEEPVKTPAVFSEKGRKIPGSSAFVPPAAGLMIAAYVVRHITGKEQ